MRYQACGQLPQRISKLFSQAGVRVCATLLLANIGCHTCSQPALFHDAVWLRSGGSTRSRLRRLELLSFGGLWHAVAWRLICFGDARVRADGALRSILQVVMVETGSAGHRGTSLEVLHDVGEDLKMSPRAYPPPILTQP